MESSIIQKRAILIVSHGSSYSQPLIQSLEKLSIEIQNAFQNHTIYYAFWNLTIPDFTLEKQPGALITVPSAIHNMLKDNITDVYVLPTFLLTGISYNKMQQDILEFSTSFHSVHIGSALLTNQKSYSNVAHALMSSYEITTPNTATLLVGHGTKHSANDSYAILQQAFDLSKNENYYVITLNDFDNIDDYISILKQTQVKNIILAPLLMIAGYHAQNDIAGIQDTSLRSLLLKAGFSVECRLNGLIELPYIQNLFIKDLYFHTL